MKNIVIAAGYATRLGELTKNFPKPLLKIGNSTILGKMLDDIDRIPEIDEHIIITNHKFAGIFEEWAKVNFEDPLRGEIQQNSDLKLNNSELNLNNFQAQPALRENIQLKKPITIVDDGTETNDTRLGHGDSLLCRVQPMPAQNPAQLFRRRLSAGQLRYVRQLPLSQEAV